MKKTLTLIGLRREVYTSLMNCNERKRYASKMKYKTWQTFSTCHHLKKRTMYENHSKKSHFTTLWAKLPLLNFRAKNDQIELSYSENIFCAKIQIFKNGFWIFMPKMIKFDDFWRENSNICTEKKSVKSVESIRKFAIFSNIFFLLRIILRKMRHFEYFSNIVFFREMCWHHVIL